MRINKLSFHLGLVAVFILAPLTAVEAQGARVYFGAAFGAYSIKKSNLNDNDRVLKAVIGAELNKWFGIEGSWTDFNRTDNGGDRFDADGKGLAGVLLMPAGTTAAIFVKGGQYWWNSDSFLGGALGASKGNDPFWGVGLKFGFNDFLALRLEVERYDVSNTHLDTVTGGIEFKF